MGNRHVARSIIRHGCSDPSLVPAIIQAIGAEKKKEAKGDARKRKHEEEEHGAGEPVWNLRQNALRARKTLRDAERLYKTINQGTIAWDYLRY